MVLSLLLACAPDYAVHEICVEHEEGFDIEAVSVLQDAAGYPGSRDAVTMRLAPDGDAGWQAQHLQLTLADFVVEIHDTHHPIAGMLFYEDQEAEALRRSAVFREQRLSRYLGYFERVLALNTDSGGRWLAGADCSHADLSLFQVIAGLEYAFPNTLGAVRGDCPKLFALHERVSERPNISAYLNSERRIPFNQDGIFRHYPELDPPA